MGMQLKLSAVSGVAIGVIFGVFAATVNFMMHHSVPDSLMIATLAPVVVAVTLVFATLTGYPLYATLCRMGLPGLGRISYEVLLDQVVSERPRR